MKDKKTNQDTSDDNVLRNTLISSAVVSGGTLAYAVHNLGKRKLILQKWGLDVFTTSEQLFFKKLKQTSYDTFLKKLPKIENIQLNTLPILPSDLNRLLALNLSDKQYCVLDFQNVRYYSNNNALISSKRYYTPYILILATQPPIFNDPNCPIKCASTQQAYHTNFPLYYEQYSFNNNTLEPGPDYFTFPKLLEIKSTMMNIIFSKVDPNQPIVTDLKNRLNIYIYSEEPKQLQSSVVESHVQFQCNNLLDSLLSNIFLAPRDIVMQ